MRRIITAAFFLAIFGLSTLTASACWCFVPDVHKSFDKATDVFVGIVTEIKPPHSTSEKSSLSERLFTIKFKIEKSWKGSVSTEISVLADQGWLGCFSYHTVYVGEKYLVYADSFPSDEKDLKGFVTINLCNRTGLIGEQLTRSPYGYESSDWLGRPYRTEDLKEL